MRSERKERGLTDAGADAATEPQPPPFLSRLIAEEARRLRRCMSYRPRPTSGAMRKCRACPRHYRPDLKSSDGYCCQTCRERGDA